MRGRVKKILAWVFLALGFLLLFGALGFYMLREHIRVETIALQRPIIAFGAYECLIKNKITAPQSDEKMAALIYCKNPQGVDYLWTSKDLKPSGDRYIREDFFKINYRVYFDGTNVIVQSSDLEKPFLLDINSVRQN